MTQTALPTFTALNQALGETALKLHPSQVHGLIVGVLCGNANDAAAWETLIGGKQEDTAHRVLQDIYDASKKQLVEFLFEFQLLLPSDKSNLTARAEALTLWCQGFLTGLKMADVPLTGRAPSDLTEAINDLIEIAKMNHEEVVANDEDEAAYTELIEYVRMAVILVYQDLREDETGGQAVNQSKQLH